jgi:flagellar biosynthetic protein FliR
MDLFNLNYADVEKFFFVFVRISAMFLFAPILGSTSVPGKVKIGLTMVMSFLLMPTLQNIPLPQSKGLLSFALYMFSEITIGLMVAYIARLIFISVQIAGTIVDFQMGFGVVNVIDPQTESQVSITAQVMNIISILLFLALDGHHFLIHAVVQSFELINPNTFNFSGGTLQFIMEIFTAAFAVAIKIAAPIVAGLFFVSVALGLVARTVPQMNVFIVGFPLQIGMGLVMFWFSMNYFGQIFRKILYELPKQLYGLMLTF